jgi:hypothetical protein
MPGTVYMTDAAKNANIKVVSIPQAVEGLTFVDGYTDSWGYGYSAQEIGILTANNLAKNGWKDLVVLVEILSQGGGGFSQYSSSTKTLVRVTWYRMAMNNINPIVNNSFNNSNSSSGYNPDQQPVKLKEYIINVNIPYNKLGINYCDLDSYIKNLTGINNGVYVIYLDNSSPLTNNGIQGGDIIIEINNIRIDNSNDISKIKSDISRIKYLRVE